jgi:DNA-binding IclR family transcriptional regulator
MAILAMLPQQQILSIISMNALEKFTPFTITSQKQLLKKIDQIKQRGYAVSIQERYSYTAGVAAPCFIGQSVIGSIAVIGPAERIQAAGVAKMGKTVRRFAERLSGELGYSQNAQSVGPANKRLLPV